MFEADGSPESGQMVLSGPEAAVFLLYTFTHHKIDNCAWRVPPKSSLAAVLSETELWLTFQVAQLDHVAFVFTNQCLDAPYPSTEQVEKVILVNTWSYQGTLVRGRLCVYFRSVVAMSGYSRNGTVN